MKPISIKAIRMPRGPIVRNYRHSGPKQRIWLSNRKMSRACSNTDPQRFSGVTIPRARSFRSFHCSENQYPCKSLRPIWLESMWIANSEGKEKLAVQIMEKDWCVMTKKISPWPMTRASRIPRPRALTPNRFIRGSRRDPEGRGLQRNLARQERACPIR